MSAQAAGILNVILQTAVLILFMQQVASSGRGALGEVHDLEEVGVSCFPSNNHVLHTPGLCPSNMALQIPLSLGQGAAIPALSEFWLHRIGRTTHICHRANPQFITSVASLLGMGLGLDAAAMHLLILATGC